MPEELPAEALYDVSTPTEVAVSPDGERAAVVVGEHDGEADQAHSSVFVVPTDGSREPHRLTRASDAAQPAWSPDGTRLGFVAARDPDVDRRVGRPAERSEDEDGKDGADSEDNPKNGSSDDEPEPQVWAFDLERGGDAIQVTDREEGVREFDWGPAGERVVVAARDPTEEEKAELERRREDGPIEIERLQHKVDGTGWTDSVTTYLFVVDVQTGDSRRLDEAYGQGAREPLVGLQPAWGPGDRIAFVSNRSARPDDTAAMDVYVIDPAGGEPERLTDGNVVASDLEWSPDGSRITFASWPADNWYRPREVYVLDRDGYESVSGSLDRTTSWWGPPVWLDGETILAGVADEGWVRPYTFEASTGASTPRFEAFGRDRSVRLVDSGGDRVVCSVDDPDAGHELYALARSELDAPFDEAATRLTTFNDELAAESTAAFHRIATEHDGRAGDGEPVPVTVESMVYTPAAFDPADPEPRPTILWPHGGPMSYDDPEFSFPIMYFTSRGYVVLKPNYRGSSSYGRAFCETLRGRWGSVEIVDQLAALEELIERGWADPSRLFATGFSYGGISTGFLVTETDRFAAAAPEHGIYDRRAAFGTGDSQVWHTNELGLPWEEPEAYDANSSITAVGEIETPLLITAGENDWRCPPTQAEQLYVSVRKRGVDAKLVVYQEEHHDVGDPDRAVHRLETLEAWFERHDPTGEDDD